MIKDRPDYLLAQPGYDVVPASPYELDWTTMPELIRAATLDLGGVQPITRAMCEAAGGPLRDRPSEGEVKLFREKGTQFQMISLVASVVMAKSGPEGTLAKPFALTIIPASKRGQVSLTSIDFIEKVDVDAYLATEPAYVGYDPFAGGWSMYGGLGTLLEGGSRGYLDEIGLVVDQYFLATDFDPADTVAVDVGMPSEKLARKYREHRNRLFFSPFERVQSRRVWGAETPIELFLIQGLASRGIFAQLQMMIMEDRTIYPSLYHLWADLEVRHAPGMITEADLFFPEQKVAVFCDGALHQRRKQREKDLAIDAKLAAIGIKSVRVSGREINFDMAPALDRIEEALGSA